MVEVGAARKTEENVKVEDRWTHSSASNHVDRLAVKSQCQGVVSVILLNNSVQKLLTENGHKLDIQQASLTKV